MHADQKIKSSSNDASVILSVEGLKTYFLLQNALVKAVDGVNLGMSQGEVLALVGETGSGKTITAHSILGLLDSAPGIVQGKIIFDKVNLLEGLDKFSQIENNGEREIIKKDVRGWDKLHQKRMDPLRGRKITMIFQEPVSSLDPYYMIGEQIVETIITHLGKEKKQAYDLAFEWLQELYLEPPESYFPKYAWQLSGGECQRVMIAMALAANPELLIADEPTTSLDAYTEREIMRLLSALREKYKLSVLFICHDINLVLGFADKIAVMFNGTVVEQFPVGIAREEERQVMHPYTHELFFRDKDKGSLAEEDDVISTKMKAQMAMVPSRGCKFLSLCPHLVESGKGLSDQCRNSSPPQVETEKGHWVSCWRYA